MDEFINKPHELVCSWCGAIYDNCDGEECEHSSKRTSTCDVECFMGRRKHASRVDLDVRGGVLPYPQGRSF